MLQTITASMTAYGTARSFNGLRRVKALQGKGESVSVFLMTGAVFCAKAG